MEAFDVIHTLSRYYGYSPQQAEPAYHLLLQAEALDKSACSHLTGLVCFFRMHNPAIADRISLGEGCLDQLLMEMEQGAGKHLPDTIKAGMDKIWAYKRMGC